MTELFERVVFSVGAAEYRWEDLVIAAQLRGDWDRLRERVRDGLACLTRFEEEDETFEAEIAAAAHEFRYARGLIATAELEEWLGRWGVTTDEWIDYVSASVLRETWSDELEAIVAEYAPSGEEIDEAMTIEGICSGDFARWAWALAGRAAIHDAEEPTDSAAAEPIIERLALLEAAHRRLRQRVVTHEAIESQVRSRAAEWIRLDCQILSFSDEQEAREAALCVRDDGQALDTVAAEANRVVREQAMYIEDVDADFRDRLLAAQPGELVGPLSRGGEFLLFFVREKVPASAADADIASRAEAAILQRVIDPEINVRVKWQCRF